MASIRGIRTWKIPRDKIKNWKRLNPHVPKNEARDCSINSLHYLGIFDDKDIAEIEMLSTRANVRGTAYEDILKMIFESYAKKGLKAEHHYYTSNTLEEIRKEIQNDEYTIVSYDRADTTAHTVVFTKQNGVLYVYDPQDEKCYNDIMTLEYWQQHEKIIKFYFLVQDKVTRHRDSKTKQLRKKKPSNERPTKKMKLNSSTKSSNKTKSSSKTKKRPRDDSNQLRKKKPSDENPTKKMKLNSSTKSSDKMDISPQ
jgi:hypothetical protein